MAPAAEATSKRRTIRLKARGFRWDGTFWRKSVDRSRTVQQLVEMIPQASWFSHGQRLEIQIRRSDGEVAAVKVVEDGQLRDDAHRH